MRYLLDANVLIDADRDYYPLDRVPEFWGWLVYQAEDGTIKVPSEIYDEVVAGTGQLVDWLKDNKDTLVLDDEADPDTIQHVVSEGYAPDLTEDEVERIGRDPFIVAYALGFDNEVTVVTTEVSKPSRQRANRQLPDVCADFDVSCTNTFALVQALDFSTDWQSK